MEIEKEIMKQRKKEGNEEWRNNRGWKKKLKKNN